MYFNIDLPNVRSVGLKLILALAAHDHKHLSSSILLLTQKLELYINTIALVIIPSTVVHLQKTN